MGMGHICTHNSSGCEWLHSDHQSLSTPFLDFPTPSQPLAAYPLVLHCSSIRTLHRNMSWRSDDENDTGNEINPGVFVAISAGAIVFLGIVIVKAAKRLPPPACFRTLDRNLMYLPFVGFFLIPAAIIITSTSTKLGSMLPIAVGGSCFLAWGALIAFVIWRAKVNQQTSQAEHAFEEAGDGSVAVYAIAIDSDSRFKSSTSDSNTHFHHSMDGDVSSAMAWGGAGDSGAFDGGSGFTGCDTGGATSSSTGGGGGCGNSD